jgi:hypothetical protein
LLAGIGLGGIHLLRLARQNVQRTNLVEHVDIGAVAGTHSRGIAGRQQADGQQQEGSANAATDRRGPAGVADAHHVFRHSSIVLGPKNQTHGSFAKIDPGWSVHLAAEYDSNNFRRNITVIIAWTDHHFVFAYSQISALAPRLAAKASERAATKFYLRG